MPPRRSKNMRSRWDYEIPSEASEISDGLRSIVEQFCQGQRIVIFEGAGTSVSAGIPDFRSMNGIYARYMQEGEGKQGEQLFHVDMLNHIHTRKQFLQICDDIYNLAKVARPGLYHQLIDCLTPRVRRRYCYNIDGIGTKDSNFLALNTTVPSARPWPTTIAMHGLLTYVYCNQCGQVFEHGAEKYGRFVDEPTCPDCEQGTLLPRIELYGDTVGTWTFDTEEHERIIRSDLRHTTDVLFAVGTTAAVDSVQQNLKLFASLASLRIWLNPKDPPPNGMKKMFVKICGTADDFAGLCMRYLKEAGSHVSRNHAERIDVVATKGRNKVEPIIRFHRLRKEQRRKRLESRSSQGSDPPIEQLDETIQYPSEFSLLSGKIGRGESRQFKKADR